MGRGRDRMRCEEKTGKKRIETNKEKRESIAAMCSMHLAWVCC